MKTLIAGLSVLSAAASISDAFASSPNDGKVCEQFLLAISASEGVPLGVLYAVGLTETGKKGSLHPYALNIEGKTIFTANREEALAQFALARKQGKKLIDLGCMQVNYHYHRANFNSVSDMVDPLKNITYAAKFLKSLRESEGSWTAAVAKYHCSPRKPAEQKRYICSVVTNLVVTGFGAWTPEARSMCN